MPDKTIINTRITQAMGDATREVFLTMLGMDLRPDPAYLESAAGSEGLVSLIGLAGQWIGTGSISCSGEFACRIASRMLMMEAPAVNEEVLDAVGEITNMIVGGFKTAMEDCLGPLWMSLPTVIYGRNFIARSMSSSEWNVAPFSCDGARLEVKVCLTPNRQPQHGVRTDLWHMPQMPA